MVKDRKAQLVDVKYPAFLIFVLATSACTQPPAGETVEEGDAVDINYIGKLDTGAVFDTSYAGVARNESIEKVPYFRLRNEYAPLHFIVGSGELIAGIDEGVIGMKLDDERVLRIPPEKGFGFPDKSLIKSVSRRQEIDRFVNLSMKDFVNMFSRAPIVGESLNAMWNITVVSVTKDSVTIEHRLKKGETLKLYDNPWTTSVFDVTEDKIVLLQNFNEGMYGMVVEGFGRVVGVENESALFDFNSPFAGKTLIFEIRLENITKFDASKLVSEDSPSLGPKDAKVVVVEFSDFQCPYCGAVSGKNERIVKQMQEQDKGWVPQVPRLKELAMQGKIKLVFRHFPLLSIHAEAQKAAEATECAHEQGKFWEYHDLLFENQNNLKGEDLKGYAETLGLDKGKFDKCLDSGVKSSKVLKDLRDGTDLGVRGTPTFFIGGKRISSAVTPFSEFEQAINRKLGKEVAR